jgi:Mg2+ and Co2+ transporter CorA
MVSETATLTPHQPHGPAASALKWVFKGYIRAQRTLSDMVAQARAEAHSAVSDTLPASPSATIESVPHDGMCVRWISSGAAEQRTVEELGALLDREDGFVWVDIPTIGDTAERVLIDVFKFHPLAVRDCREPGHVPKVHAYADHLFMMLHVPEREPNGQIQHRELNQFIGSRYLVTVHERLDAAALVVGQLETSAVLGRIEAGRAHPGVPAELSYAILTRLSARMESLVEQLARSVAALNRSLMEGRGVSEAVIDDMFELREALLAVETIIVQNHAICARMATLASRVAPPGPHPLLDDVLDQFGRIRELCQANRDLLQGVLDFSRTRATAKMDRAMSRLALLGAVAVPVSVLSDLYGMNVLVFGQPQLYVLAMAIGALAILTLGMFRLAEHYGSR